jgi:putative tricarboxylic transport membrane protein
MMRRFGLPVLPLILGVILGPRLEGQLRKTLQLSAGDPAGLFSEPIAVGIYVIIGIILAWPLVLKVIRRSRPAKAMPIGYDDAEPSADHAVASVPPPTTTEATIPTHRKQEKT